MRPSPLLRLLGGLLAVAVLLAGAGCSGGDGADSEGSADTDSADSGEPGSAGTSARADDGDGAGKGEDDDEAGEPTVDPRPEAKVVCEPFTEMVDALEGIDYRSADPDEVVAEMAPVLKKWAARMPDLERPPGMAAETWAALELLSQRVRELPDRPTAEQLAAVEEGLTPEQRHQIDDAAEWYQQHCGLP